MSDAPKTVEFVFDVVSPTAYLAYKRLPAIADRTGATVAHNPLSNLKLASGFARVPDMLEAGIRVTLGTDGAISGNDIDMWLALRLAVRDIGASRAFYASALGFDDKGGGRLRLGESEIWLEAGPGRPAVGPLLGIGYRYLTLQIDDCDASHGEALAAGGTEGRPPRTLGEVVRYSFVRDPDGNWIELSERSTLTGGLKPR